MHAATRLLQQYGGFCWMLFTLKPIHMCRVDNVPGASAKEPSGLVLGIIPADHAGANAARPVFPGEGEYFVCRVVQTGLRYSPRTGRPKVSVAAPLGAAAAVPTDL